MREGLRTTELWQYAAVLSLIVLITLALTGAWPFDAAPIAADHDATLAELALGDRLTIGLIRTAVLAVVGYVVVSVPALVLDRRWIQGFTTTGLTADTDGRSERERIKAWLEDLRSLGMRIDQEATDSDVVELIDEEEPGPEVDDDG